MYNIYKGYIKEVTNIKNRDNITTYKIYKVSDSLIPNRDDLVFHNIAHGYQGDANAMDSVHAVGALVYFIGDSTTKSDGVVLTAIQETPAARPKIIPDGQDYTTLFQSLETPPVLPGDYLWTKYEALVQWAYTGLLKLRSKIGLEIFLNPITDTIQALAKRAKIQFGGFRGNTASIDLDDATGDVSLNLAFITDTTEKNQDASLLHVKLGQLKDRSKRFLASIISLKTKDVKFQTEIDLDGVIHVKGDSLKINFNDKSTIEITNEGVAYIKTKEFYLGQGTTDQYFIRGKDFKDNYDDLLELLQGHKHMADGIPSFELRNLPVKKLEVNKELSDKNKLD